MTGLGLILPDVGNLGLLDAALAYAESGIPVFPLAQRSKRPIYMGGFNQATVQADTIKQWWAEHPDANIGAVPGRVGCIVPDIDTVEARHAWYEKVIVETAATQTGGGVGVHPWYYSEKLAQRSHWRLDDRGGPFNDDRLANLLFRASGGYVVVAPSIHPDTGQPYTLTRPGVPISALPSDIETALLAIPARQAGGAHTADSGVAREWIDQVSAPMSGGGLSILAQRIGNIRESPKDARNDTLLAEVGVLLNAAYLWDIDLDEAREAIRAVYVPHVADTRKARDANREVDHAFDYVATQRYWEGPLEEDIGGVPVKPELRTVTGPSFPAPVTPEDRRKAHVKELREGKLPLVPLIKGEIPEIEWLVDGILARRRLTAIVAEAKIGKSLLLLDIAASLAVGHQILGKAHGPRRVLYIDYEMTPEDVSMRLQDMGFPREDEATIALLEENLEYWQIPPLSPLDTEEGGVMLVDAVADGEFDLVIVDTLAAAVAGAENESDTYRAARMFTWAPLKALGVTVVRVDHLGKDKSKGARGSSMKRDDVDVAWELVAGTGPDQLILRRDRSRLPGVEEKIQIARLSGPMRHVRVGKRVWAMGAVSLARAIVAAGINMDSTDRLDGVLQRAGIVYDQRHVAEARSYIEQGMPSLGPDMATDVQDPRKESPAPTPPPPPGVPPGRPKRLRGLGSGEVEVT